MNKTIGPNLGRCDLDFGFYFDCCTFEASFFNVFIVVLKGGQTNKITIFFMAVVFFRGVGSELVQETWVCRTHLDDFLLKKMDYYRPY